MLPVDVRASLEGVVGLMAAALKEMATRADVDPLRGWMVASGEVEPLLATICRGLHGEDSHHRQLPDVPEADAGPMGHLCRVYEVGPAAHVALSMALGVELDASFARLVAYLNDHAAHTRPTVGLAWDVAGLALGPARLAMLDTPLFLDGVLTLEGEGPVATRALRLEPTLLPRLSGHHTQVSTVTCRPVQRDRPGCSEEVSLPPALASAVARGECAVIVVGRAGSGRRALGRGLLARLGVGDVGGASDPVLLRREARLRGCGILVDAPPDAAASWWRALLNRGLPMVAVAEAARLPDLRAQLETDPVIVRVPTPSVAARRTLWDASAVGKQLPGVIKDHLAARFPFGPEQIRRSAQRASWEADPEQRISELCQEAATRDLSRLARRVPLRSGSADLVLDTDVQREFDLLLGWVRNRSTVLGSWSMARHVGQRWGVSALFAGPPGTGKTMAASVVAAELGSELYRVDLSQVVSKYIGETEKHLDTLMSGVQEAGAILLFDEADALFGRRSEVRDARDRYANLEVGFLLQRIEEHDGIVLLSSNRMGDMDDAFLRRFQFVLTFPKPDAALRRQLWQRMVPWEVAHDDVDLDWLADRFEMTGGEIRNAVVAGGFLAAEEGGCVRHVHLLHAARREVRKSGRFLRPAEREDPPVQR